MPEYLGVGEVATFIWCVEGAGVVAVTAAAVAYSHCKDGNGSHLEGRMAFWRRSRSRIRGGISYVL